MDYLPALALQRVTHAAVVAGDAPDTLLLVEHEGLFTAGKRTEPGDRPPAGVRVEEVDRGGRITWHGPGQLTGYPILRLPSYDVLAHVRRMEDLVIEVCGALGVATSRIEGRSGVWIAGAGRPDAKITGAGQPDAKIAAVGVRVAQNVTMHGFALNCDCDLSAYDAIVPCGLRDARVTSLSVELGRTVTIADVLPLVRQGADTLTGALVP